MARYGGGGGRYYILGGLTKIKGKNNGTVFGGHDIRWAGLCIMGKGHESGDGRTRVRRTQGRNLNCV